MVDNGLTMTYSILIKRGKVNKTIDKIIVELSMEGIFQQGGTKDFTLWEPRSLPTILPDIA